MRSPAMNTPESNLPPRPNELRELLALKFGDILTTGWGVQRRQRFGYFTPDDWYEALIHRYVQPETVWLDVGGGRSLFPHNLALSQLLSQRCTFLAGVDPSPNILDNPFVHDRAQCLLEDFTSPHQFDLATFRMVAEHVTDPPKVIQTLQRLLKPGGRVVIYTVYRWSPITLASRLVPFGLHHRIKRFFWGGEEKDTFPAVYRMNTHRELKRLFHAGDFEERLFLQLDDLAAFSQIKPLNWLELVAWKILHSVGLRYPESCLLGVYQKMSLAA